MREGKLQHQGYKAAGHALSCQGRQCNEGGVLRVQASISIRISPEFSADKSASGLEVVVPMPREVQRVNCDNLKPSQARPSSCFRLSRAPISFTGFAAVMLMQEPLRLLGPRPASVLLAPVSARFLIWQALPLQDVDLPKSAASPSAMH